ncbi:MAG: phosphatase PAP2 family protein [Isosphaeraceae bacterium]|nr:phosphatase PAP2 family protein [Isosphaeraceae bacterium]
MRHSLRWVIEWLGGHELVVLVGLFVITAGSWGFLKLADEVLEGDTLRFDERIIRDLRRPDNPAVPIGPPWMEEAGRDITALGSVAVLVLVSAAAAGFLWLDRRFGTLWLVLGATASGFALSSALKAFYRRPRPDVVPHLMQAYHSSFPSGHSMMSAVVYLTLGALMTRVFLERRLKFYVLAVAILLTGLVGASRIYMGVHYPTDVLAGWMAGLVWATCCWLISRRLQRQGVIEPER